MRVGKSIRHKWVKGAISNFYVCASSRRENPVLAVSDHVRLNTESIQSLVTKDIEFRGIWHIVQATRAQIRMCEWTG